MLNETQIKHYLERLRYTGDNRPTPDLLYQLQRRHLLAIPFENLDIHYHIPIVLDINKIFLKIINNRRGGFCYELNALFGALLQSLGFEVRMVAGRVFDEKTGVYGQPYDHLALLVTMPDMQYLVDVGFGEFAFEPLKMQMELVQQDKKGRFMIKKFDEQELLVLRLGANKQEYPEYLFSTQACLLSDFENACLYHQTNPNSHFTQNKLITIATPEGRISLINNTLKIRHIVVQETTLHSEAEFEAALLKWFGVKML